MKLATRLSAFFLGALAVVLVGFDVALFVSASAYLDGQVDERLASALAILTAATETHPDGVEWEPHERELPLGLDSGPDQVRWMVHDGDGRLVDRSRNLNDADLTPEWLPSAGRAVIPRDLSERQGQKWRTAQAILLPRGRVAASGSVSAYRGPVSPAPEPSGAFHRRLVLTVATSIGPVTRTVAKLGWVLAGLTASVWSVAALLGRWLVRRALAPFREMVDSARGLDAADAGWSIPESGTGDELDELAAAFNDLLGRLRVAYERQGRFAGDASHQLRTPLTALIGQIEVALRRDRPADEYRRVLTLVRTKARDLAQIVSALLFLGRAEAEAGLPDAVALDLSAWAVEHAASHPLADRIEVDVRPRPPLRVRAHPALLGQLVDNLIDNAAKYGEPLAPIGLRVESASGSATIAVDDRGPGIDPADLPRLFEPFYRSGRARLDGRPGVGLGLAIVQRIAAAMGGTMEVESGPGRGSRFALRLPRLVDHPAEGGVGPDATSAGAVPSPEPCSPRWN